MLAAPTTGTSKVTTFSIPTTRIIRTGAADCSHRRESSQTGHISDFGRKMTFGVEKKVPKSQRIAATMETENAVTLRLFRAEHTNLT